MIQFSNQRGWFELEAKARLFPNNPGVYLMKDREGQVLYIGKAAHLKKRISSYFSKTTERYQIGFLMKKVANLEYLVTENEAEALLLENTLIKKHSPKYNIQLRDDKSYLSLKLSMLDRFPRLYVTRQIKKDGSLYFGPYASAFACRETVDFIEQHFRLRTCSDHEFANRVRPCIQYQIHRCDAPCVGFIQEERYRQIVDQVQMFLQGKKQDLITDLKKSMQEYSRQETFEKAAQCRDLIEAIERTLEKQAVVRHQSVDQDAIGLYREGERVTICLVQIRQGKVWESRIYHLQAYAESSEVLGEFLLQYYAEGRLLPDQVLLPFPPESLKPLSEHLNRIHQKRSEWIVPKKGDRRDLIFLAMRNAQEGFRHRGKGVEEIGTILAGLQKMADLQNYPRRIECFDISNLSGQQAVGSLVCFVDGEPSKEGYRRFRIKRTATPNDFAMMQEVLERRLLAQQWTRPDLILLDGGKGQLNIVVESMRQLNVTGIDLLALAKAKGEETVDKVYLPGRKNPLRLKPRSSILHLLMRIRDEAHRFAINYHKKLRHKEFFENHH